MSIIRSIKCDAKGCTNTATEASHGEGWMGWGHVEGFAFMKKTQEGEITEGRNVNLCPSCMKQFAATFLDMEG